MSDCDNDIEYDDTDPGYYEENADLESIEDSLQKFEERRNIFEYFEFKGDQSFFSKAKLNTIFLDYSGEFSNKEIQKSWIPERVFGIEVPASYGYPIDPNFGDNDQTPFLRRNASDSNLIYFRRADLFEYWRMVTRFRVYRRTPRVEVDETICRRTNFSTTSLKAALCDYCNWTIRNVKERASLSIKSTKRIKAEAKVEQRKPYFKNRKLEQKMKKKMSKQQSENVTSPDGPMEVVEEMKTCRPMSQG